MYRHTPLPRFNRTDFYRFQDEELLTALSEAIAAHAAENREVELTTEQEAVLAWALLVVDVLNGGFTQFFYNHGGDRGVAPLAQLLESLGVPKARAVLDEAVAVYRQHESEFLVDNPWDGLFGGIKQFDKLDRAFGGILLRANRALEKWVRSHIAELADGESGEPIDARFTGAVEVAQANGLVGQYLEVKKGKPHGAYREFFDDGTVRKVVFYKAGKISGDFWPDGQLKRKESKRGDLTIIEWFHRSGRLQKRLVKDKRGYTVEPIRMFHENGQLAEELTVVEGDRRGPWLKFFEDGSPRLHAEYGPDEALIVHNAWNDERKQVVKDGAGTFRYADDDIGTPYSLVSEGYWQDDRELQKGIPHGKMTRYMLGTLDQVAFYRNGVLHGDCTDYWDNGRVKSITKYVDGEATATKSFPKFDQPVPAVLLIVEANEKLYTAWRHAAVEEYPHVLNLDEIQAQLEVPEFLREVYERNLSGTLKSDYEDANTFDDGIAYFLTVNSLGEVASASASGSGVYSGGHWDDYIPLLLKLRFTPGRIRGRAIECRVLARVDHTFVEGANRPARERRSS